MNVQETEEKLARELSYTNHARERMFALRVTEKQIVEALVHGERGTTRSGCTNHWLSLPGGRRMRVTWNPIDNVIVTVCFQGQLGKAA